MSSDFHDFLRKTSGEYTRPDNLAAMFEDPLYTRLEDAMEEAINAFMMDCKADLPLRASTMLTALLDNLAMTSAITIARLAKGRSKEQASEVLDGFVERAVETLPVLVAEYFGQIQREPRKFGL